MDRARHDGGAVRFPGMSRLADILRRILDGPPPGPDPVEEALQALEPGDVAGARRVIEAARAHYGKVPDVLVANLLDMFPDEQQLDEVWRMIEEAGWSGGPIL